MKLIPWLLAVLPLAITAEPLSTTTENLADVYHLARANDQQYQATLAQSRALLASKGLRSAALKPQISAYYNLSRSDNDVVNSFPITAENGQTQLLGNANAIEEDTREWGVTLSQTLFNASDFATARQGKYEALSGEITAKQAEQDLVQRLSGAYFNTLRADNNFRVAQAQLEADEWLLKQTEGRFDVGAVAYTDVHQAKAAFDLSTAQLLAAELAVDIQRNALSVLTGGTHSALAAVSKGFTPSLPEPNDASQWQERARQNNLQVLLSEANMKAAKLAAKSAKLARLPTVSAAVNLVDRQTDVTQPNVPSYTNITEGNSITLSVTAPLYAGGSISASKRQAQANYQAALQQYQLATRQAEQQTLSAFSQLNVAVSQLTAQRQALRSAKSAADSISAGYDAGLNTIIDLVAARRSFYAAQTNFDNAKFDYLEAYLALEGAVGQLDASDISFLNQQLTRM